MSLSEKERIKALEESINQTMPLLVELSNRAERIVYKRYEILDRGNVFCFPSDVIASFFLDRKVKVTVENSCEETDSFFVLLSELLKD